MIWESYSSLFIFGKEIWDRVPPLFFFFLLFNQCKFIILTAFICVLLFCALLSLWFSGSHHHHHLRVTSLHIFINYLTAAFLNDPQLYFLCGGDDGLSQISVIRWPAEVPYFNLLLLSFSFFFGWWGGGERLNTEIVFLWFSFSWSSKDKIHVMTEEWRQFLRLSWTFVQRKVSRWPKTPQIVVLQIRSARYHEIHVGGMP